MLFCMLFHCQLKTHSPQPSLQAILITHPNIYASDSAGFAIDIACYTNLLTYLLTYLIISCKWTTNSTKLSSFSRQVIVLLYNTHKQITGSVLC